MRKFLFFICSSSLFAQTGATVNLLNFFVKCPSPNPSVLVWDGSKIFCAIMGAGFSLNSGVLTVTSLISPNPPKFETETLSLSSLAAGSVSLSYTTLKPVISGFVAVWYKTSTPLASFSTPVSYTAPGPVVVNLPSSWTSSDEVIFFYQSQ